MLNNFKPNRFLNHFNQKTIYLLLLISSIATVQQMQAQEVRLFGGVLALGEVAGGFTTIGAGIESPISRKFTLNFDVSAGFGNVGSTFELKPSVLFYFRSDHKGFFIGPALKYITLTEKANKNDYTGTIYAMGITVGVRTTFKNNLDFFTAVNPHAAIGGENESGTAGIGFQVGFAYRL